MSVKGRIIHGLMILRNHRIKNRVVVFESDDWGSIRVPSLECVQYLRSKGITLCRPNDYDRVDTLASKEDLECLIDTLMSVRDSKGNPAKMTLNTCVANPDFEKIKNDNFTSYYYEPFTETLKKYPRHSESFHYWKIGIDSKVFQPQFHGREHLNFQKWMNYLRDREEVRECLNQGIYSLRLINESVDFLGAYNIAKDDEKTGIQISVREGLEMFHKIFGFRSKSMIAPCYIWDDYIEDTASDMGVKYIQGGYIQRHSTLQKKQGKAFTGHYLGEKNKNGQKYLIRNCAFEPTQDSKLNADLCLRQIDNAFKMRLPAIVSCHRLNFIGDLDKNNRTQNLKDFKYLLSTLVRKYPDVEFKSSDEVFD